MANLFKKNKKIRTEGRTNRQTNGRTVRLYYAPNFKIWGHKNIVVRRGRGEGAEKGNAQLIDTENIYFINGVIDVLNKELI